MFYLVTHSTHWFYGYMADIWQRTIETERGYSFPLAGRVLLYAPSHRQDSKYHSLCYTSHGALAGIRIFLQSYEFNPHNSNIIAVIRTLFKNIKIFISHYCLSYNTVLRYTFYKIPLPFLLFDSFFSSSYFLSVQYFSKF